MASQLVIFNVFFTSALSTSSSSTSLPWQTSFFILICLRIPKSEPTSNGSDCWLIAANAENRLIWRARLVVGWSHLALNRLSKQASLTAGRSVWHVHPSLGHTTKPDSSQPCHFVLSQFSLCWTGPDLQSDEWQTSGIMSRFTTNQHKSCSILLRKIQSLFFLFKQNV